MNLWLESCNDSAYPFVAAICWFRLESQAGDLFVAANVFDGRNVYCVLVVGDEGTYGSIDSFTQYCVGLESKNEKKNHRYKVTVNPPDHSWKLESSIDLEKIASTRL